MVVEARFHVARGERIYAIGDVHGCAGLLGSLFEQLAQDNARRPPMRTRLVFLGDVVDRGPESAAVVTRLMRYTGATQRVIVLKGNHEEVMERVLLEDAQGLPGWLAMGGAATLVSWGVDPDLLASQNLPLIHAAAVRAIPGGVLRWLRRRPLFFRSGDVVFVHAGIRPGLALKRQRPQDLLWIGPPFTTSEGPFPMRVVHGHTVYEDGPRIEPFRIGVDTGAYRTGVLSAVGLEGDQHWIVRTGPQDAETSGFDGGHIRQNKAAHA